MDICLKNNNQRFAYRASGVLIHNNKVLLVRDEDYSYFYFAGGKVHLGETSTEAVVREFKEETNFDVGVDRMLWVLENFFEENSIYHHTIEFVYLLKINNLSVFEQNEEFVIEEEGIRHFFYWCPLEKAKGLKIYPLIIYENIESLPNETKHIIEKKNT